MIRTLRCALPALLAPLLLGSLASATELSALRTSRLAVGQHFEITAGGRVYRGEVVDYRTGKCSLRTSADGGQTFDRARTVYLLGATRDRQEGLLLVIMGEAKVGMKLELGIDDLEPEHRYLTEPVTRISIDDPSPSAA